MTQTLRNTVAFLSSRLARRLAPARHPSTDSGEPEPSYDDVFSHGYLLTNSDSRQGVREGWHQVSIGPFRCYLEPSTQYKIHIEDLCSVLLIGQVVDIDRGEIDRSRIARQVAKAYKSRGVDGAIKYVAYLGGRFTCYLYADSTLTAVPDCSASQSVYWHSSNGVCSLSTHSYLLAQHHDLEVDELTLELLNKRKELQPRFTVHMPALQTPFAGVKPIVANCALHIPTPTKRPEHRRFYPISALPERSFDKAFELFNQIFYKHIRFLGRMGSTGISLTGGVDSRSTFAVLTHVLKHGPRTAFNYINFETATKGDHDDLYIASRIARQARVPFTIARTDRPDDNGRFRDMFAKSFRVASQAPNIARALYEDVPHDIYEFASNVAEIGSVFYRHREESLWTAEKMASVYGHSPAVGEDQDFRAVFASYSEYCQFAPETSYGIDPYDLFYWEHRLTRWAANRYHETDLGHRVLLPFNSRALVEAMLSAPLENRQNKDFQLRLVSMYE